MADVPIEPCRGCGTPKRIDSECAASEQRIARNQEQSRVPLPPGWPFAALRDLGQRVKTADEKLAAVQALIDHARKVSPSDRMVIYLGDLEHALGLSDTRARIRTGSNE